MRKTEAFSANDFLTEFFILSPEIEEGIQISVIGIVKLITNITGLLLFSYPDADGVSAFGIFFELAIFFPL